jgi:hypothetical protein
LKTNLISDSLRLNGKEFCSEGQEVLIPTFELACNPTWYVGREQLKRRAKLAKGNGCVVVWDKGEKNPCKLVTHEDTVVTDRKRKERNLKRRVKKV